MRTGGRTFPDAAQAGIADATVINQSRLTFSGQRGVVVAFWRLQMTNSAAAAKDRVGVDFGFSGLTPQVVFTAGNMEAVATRQVVAFAAAVIVDPPAGSFIEIRTDLSAGAVDVAAGGGSHFFLTFEDRLGEGPTVTIP